MTKRLIIWAVAVMITLWVAVAATFVFLSSGDHLLWQVDCWLFWLAVAVTVAITLVVTFIVCRHRHWSLQLVCWVVWLFNMLGLLVVAFVASFAADRFPSPTRWSDGAYLVRSNGIDSDQVLYERRGMLEYRIHTIWYAWDDASNNYSVRTCKEHDLLLIECDDYYGNRDSRLYHLDGTDLDGDPDTLLCSHLAKKNLANL